jgi:hypothetical protein
MRTPPLTAFSGGFNFLTIRDRNNSYPDDLSLNALEIANPVAAIIAKSAMQAPAITQAVPKM